MSEAYVAAIEGWYSLGNQPHLIGQRCSDCGTYFFPPTAGQCRNPACQSGQLDSVPLSREGRIWSYTDACYPPPTPYVAADPFEPFVIAAVELEREQMVILGQVVAGMTVQDLQVGLPVELTLETLHRERDSARQIWKWRPCAA
jgi:uncharacterized protein